MLIRGTLQIEGAAKNRAQFEGYGRNDGAEWDRLEQPELK
jgi:hypothetical protein